VIERLTAAEAAWRSLAEECPGYVLMHDPPSPVVRYVPSDPRAGGVAP
jgi:hypothetical protein